MDQFKKSIKEFTDLNDQLVLLNKRASEIRKQKKILEEYILTFGVKNNLDHRNIKLKHYRLIFDTIPIKKQLSIKYLKEIIPEFLQKHPQARNWQTDTLVEAMIQYIESHKNTGKNKRQLKLDRIQ